jgi:hypothetical protein
MKLTFRSVVLLVLLGVFSFGSLSCKKSTAGGFDKSTLKKIANGMSLADVEKILGPDTTLQRAYVRDNNKRVEVEVHVWKQGESVIAVTFRDGKVISTEGQGL